MFSCGGRVFESYSALKNMCECARVVRKCVQECGWDLIWRRRVCVASLLKCFPLVQMKLLTTARSPPDLPSIACRVSVAERSRVA